MPTWSGYIHSQNGYVGHTVEVEGVNTAAQAKKILQDRHPGAKISSIKCIDAYKANTKLREDIDNDLERAKQSRQKYGELEDRIKAQAGGSSGIHQSSSSSFSSSSSDEGSGVDAAGIVILGLIGVALWITWFVGPFLLPVVGMVCGYKYASKWSINLHFQLRMWLVIMSTILATYIGTLGAAGTIKLQENKALPDFLRRPTVETPKAGS